VADAAHFRIQVVRGETDVLLVAGRRQMSRISDVRRRIGILAVAALFAVSCAGLFPTPIGKIKASPREFDGKQVTVKGTVTDVASLLFVKYFLLQDETGEIPVVTERTPPGMGETVTIKGRVHEAFALGDQRLIVIVESAR
jgi:hypothetical protein